MYIVPKKFYPKNARRQAAGSHHWQQGSGVARDHRHQRMPWGDRTRHLASKRGPVNPLKSRLTAYPFSAFGGSHRPASTARIASLPSAGRLKSKTPILMTA